MKPRAGIAGDDLKSQMLQYGLRLSTTIAEPGYDTEPSQAELWLETQDANYDPKHPGEHVTEQTHANFDFMEIFEDECLASGLAAAESIARERMKEHGRDSDAIEMAVRMYQQNPYTLFKHSNSGWVLRKPSEG